jgi:iron complex transport system substrate-binding protein
MVPLPNETVEEILSSIATAGKELDRPGAAEVLVSEIRNSLAELGEGVRGRPRPLVLFVVGHAPGALRDIHAVGTGTFLDELISLAGGENLLADSPIKYPQVSREALIRRPPEVVLMARPVGGWSGSEKEFLTESWSRLVGSPTGEMRVVFLEDPRLTIPGPGVHVAARQIAAVLHPDFAAP